MQPEDLFREKSGVSRETFLLYEAWHEALLKWNKRINLVAKSTLPDFWTRHALDSWQITPHIKATDKIVMDFGSGAGFPGVAAAIDLKSKGSGQITMIESAGKKASFLKAVARDLKLPAEIRAKRIEEIEAPQVDVITARAFAPLPRLLSYAEPFLSSSTRLLLLKGEAVDEEVKAGSAIWTFDSHKIKSLSDETGCVLIVENIKRQTD